MKKLILFFIATATMLSANAQSENTMPEQATMTVNKDGQQPAIRFGYLSCDSVLHSMPEYNAAMKNLKELKAKYDSEMKRVEDEFNNKYELFLEGQSDFAPSIRQKRQAELQELMEKNMAFKEEARRLLEKATEKDHTGDNHPHWPTKRSRLCREHRWRQHALPQHNNGRRHYGRGHKGLKMIVCKIKILFFYHKGQDRLVSSTLATEA